MIAAIVFELSSRIKLKTAVWYPVLLLHIVFGNVWLLLVQLKPSSTLHVLEHPSPSKVLPSSHTVVLFYMITPSPQVSVHAILRLLLLYPLKHTHVVPFGILFMLGSQEVQLEAVTEQVIHGAVQLTKGIHKRVTLF